MEVSEYIYNLENKLLSDDVRKSSQQIKELLDESFIEFCSSGKIYNYSYGDTCYEENVSYKIIDFNIIELSEDCVLATYKLNKINELNMIYSNRSSIWKNARGKWKMIFHQGTLVK